MLPIDQKLLVPILCVFFIIIVILAVSHYFSYKELSRAISRRDSIQINAPVKLSWDSNIKKGVLSIELSTSEILTMLISKEDLKSLNEDANSILNNNKKHDSLDILKGIPGQKRTLKNSDTITISAKLYKQLIEENKKLKLRERSRVAKKQC
ncbi:hypothetical protein [Lactobacillus taiwanensis]|uniref:hypothetical protein n=1 Tax=Lactobacillus taiwanensis TaxID=508451 RepID=UPI001AEBEC22|nr:hypothetical protein [Lactobacillus taiwanensis]MCR1904185.1 hypothetical protein [Lactobacillus taiwanensis]QTQ40881.1 hypothetical protein H1A07_09390 [Lactobacillus taiwanensis]